MSDLPTTILVATGGSADSVEAARRAQETTCGYPRIRSSSARAEHVHVAPARQHVIDAAGPDVVGPPVAPDDPDASPDEVVGDREQLLRQSPLPRPYEPLPELGY